MKKPKRGRVGVHPVKKRARRSELLPDNGVFQFIPKELIIANIAASNRDLHDTVLHTNSIWKVCFEKQFIWSLCDDPLSERCQANSVFLQQRRDWKSEYLKMFVTRCKTEDNWRKGNFAVHTFKGHTDWVRCLQFENNTLISGSADKSIKIWDMENRKCKSTLIGHSRCINSLSYDNGKLASACTSVKIWDLSHMDDLEEENGRNLCKVTLHGHEDCVWCLQLKGSLCVSGSSDKTLRVWDLERGKSKQTYRGHTDCVCCLQVISHKNLILSGSSDSTIRCYDIRARDCVSVLERSDRVWCLQCEGDMLVTGASDKTIKVWDLKMRRCMRVLSGHTNSVWGLQMIGDKLVSGGADSTVRLWDLKRLEDPCINVINPNVGCVECLQFEGSKLVCGSSDSVIKMYDFLG